MRNICTIYFYVLDVQNPAQQAVNYRVIVSKLCH